MTATLPHILLIIALRPPILCNRQFLIVGVDGHGRDG